MAYITSKRRKKFSKISKLKSQNSNLHPKTQNLKDSSRSKRKYSNNIAIEQYNNSSLYFFSKIIIRFGLFLLVIGILIFTLTFYPVIKQEIFFQLAFLIGKNAQKTAQIQPIDRRFGIVIPKISANARVIANVDPFNSLIYQQALTQGVAHAQGSALPDEIGNVFIFSHSSANWYETNRYNSIFYLLNKLQSNDEIIIFYRNNKYLYRVIGKKIVDPSAISYLSKKPSNLSTFQPFTFRTLTLMTCWPPGTSYKRLIIIANLTN